jgi:protein-S-isoprenylcysteine O-methyltransferase Ste14
LKKLLSSFIALVLVATLFIVPTFAASSENYHLVQDTTNEYRYYFE